MSNKKNWWITKKIIYYRNYWNAEMIIRIQLWKSNNIQGRSGKINLLNLFELKVYNYLLQLTVLPWKTLLCHLRN